MQRWFVAGVVSAGLVLAFVLPLALRSSQPVARGTTPSARRVAALVVDRLEALGTATPTVWCHSAPYVGYRCTVTAGAARLACRADAVLRGGALLTTPIKGDRLTRFTCDDIPFVIAPLKPDRRS